MEPNNTSPHKISNNILDKIKLDELKMRPKAFFRLKVFILVAVGVTTLLISVLLLSFILFSIRISGHYFLLGFGARGFYLFMALFPWRLFLIDLLLLLMLEWLMRQFRFGYRSPIIYLLALILIAVFCVGFLIDEETNLHDNLLGEADLHHLPFLNDLYEGVRSEPTPDEGICHCLVTSVSSSTVTVQYEGMTGTTSLLELIFPADSDATSSIKVGDRLFIVGDISEGKLHALGIRKFPPVKGIFTPN